MDHVHHEHDHHHGHDHHHHDHGAVKGHAHAHDHAHHDHGHGMGDFFLEQLLTLFVCGSFGVVAILMYQLGMLKGLLSPTFHYWVLAGGIALLVLTAIRGLAVWQAAGAHRHDHAHGEACTHDHAHGADCGHDHAHGHDHSHDHGSIFWRVVVLAFPLLLFCLGLPNEEFMKMHTRQRLGKDSALGQLNDVEAKGGHLNFSFAELASAAYDKDKREMAEGQTVTLKGQFKPIGDREFTLYQLKMTCCRSDMIPLKARIVTDNPVVAATNVKPEDWVKVTGVVQFVEIPEQKQFIPVIRVKTKQGGIASTPPEA